MASVRSVDFQKPGGLSPLNSPNCESRGARVNAALDAPLQEIVDLPASLRPAAELSRQMGGGLAGTRVVVAAVSDYLAVDPPILFATR